MTVIRRKGKIWEIGIKYGRPYLKKVDTNEKKDEKTLQEIVDETEEILRERGDLALGDQSQEKPRFSDKTEGDIDRIFWYVLAELPPFLRKRFLPPEYKEESIGDIVEKLIMKDYKEGSPDWFPFKVGDKVCTTDEYYNFYKRHIEGKIVLLQTNETGSNTVATILMNGRIFNLSGGWIEKIPSGEFEQKKGE